MKVLLITPSANGMGGVEAFNRRLSKVLAGLGVEVDMLAGDELPFKDNIFNRQLQRKFGNAVFVKKNIGHLVDKYDLVICSGEYGFGLRGDNIIAYFHGSYYGFYNFCIKRTAKLREKVFYKLLILFQKKSAEGKKIVCVSSFVKDLLYAQGIKVDRVINNSIDCDMFIPKKEKRTDRLLFVGRFDYYGKGLDIVRELQHVFEIDVYTNEKNAKVKNCIESNYSDIEMADVYNKYKMLIFPSRFESCGLVTLEAMACGLPVVIFDVGVGTELKNEIPAFVVDIKTGNAENFEQRINQILGNYDYYSKKAREYVCKYHSKDAFIKDIKDLLKDCSKNITK